eukprot:5463177-Heterocapsa_arctica.AAC.1
MLSSLCLRRLPRTWRRKSRMHCFCFRVVVGTHCLRVRVVVTPTDAKRSTVVHRFSHTIA